MKQKKWRIPILVLVLLVQLLAPVGLITYHRQLNRNIETKGEIYRIADSLHACTTVTFIMISSIPLSCTTIHLLYILSWIQMKTA